MSSVKPNAKLGMVLFSLLAMLVLTGRPQASPVSPKDLKCLTDNIYWEAQGEPLMGMVWVAGVVLERVSDERWPNSVCDVIYQESQFSWTAHMERPVKYEDAYRLSQDVAKAALQGRIDVPLMNHYLRCDWKEKPHTFWWKKMKFVGQLGDHCFFYY